MSSEGPGSMEAKDAVEEPSQAHPPSVVSSNSERDALPLPGRWNVLVLSLLAFWTMGFGVWLVSAGGKYRDEYAEATSGWRVGSTRALEVTLVKADKQSLACASDQVIAGLHCGYRRDGAPTESQSPDDPLVLQPYNTVANEPFLAAGLWRSPDLAEPLPSERFTVHCNYNVKGVVRSAAVRYSPTDTFSPMGKSVTVGTLTDCVLPK